MRKSTIAAAISLSILAGALATVQPASAWPIFAKGYDKARDSAGKIVCANCHLGKKPVDVEYPSSVMAGEVFSMKIHVPLDLKIQQVGGDGSPAPLQIGAYIELPKGFKLADEKELSKEQKEAIERQPVSALYDDPARDNELIIGQVEASTIPGQELIVPVKAPDPNAKGAKVNFGKYSLYVGANRGRGQVYSNGTASNNAVYNAPATGTIARVETGVAGVQKIQYGLGSDVLELPYEKGTRVTVQGANGKASVVEIPPGPKLLETTKVGTQIKSGQPLTNNPNVGGFAAEERDIVLQDPQRVIWLLAFLGASFVCQLLLVLKKKQVVKVQDYEAQQQGI